MPLCGRRQDDAAHGVALDLVVIIGLLEYLLECASYLDKLALGFYLKIIDEPLHMKLLHVAELHEAQGRADVLTDNDFKVSVLRGANMTFLVGGEPEPRPFLHG